jgi:hypothetical protein
MTKPIIAFHDIATGEVKERQMNAAEFADYEKMQAENTARIAGEESKAEAKSELLNRLGLTADEAKLLLS